MTAAEIADARRIEAFRAWLEDECAKRDLSLNGLAKAMAAAGGKVSASIYNIASGRQPLTDDFAERIATVLKIEPAAVLDAYYNAPHADRPPARIGRPPAPRPTPEQFAFTIGSDGRASIRCHLVNLDVDKAMRVMNALMGAGVLPVAVTTTED